MRQATLIKYLNFKLPFRQFLFYNENPPTFLLKTVDKKLNDDSTNII